ncbi:MAG: translation initiation factor IF-2 [Bacillota bacterium]
MGKKRVHEVAKELGLESKELMNVLSGLGISVKSPLSTLDEAQIAAVSKHLGRSVPKDGADARRKDAKQPSKKQVSAPDAEAGALPPDAGARKVQIEPAASGPAAPGPAPKPRPVRLSQYGPGLVDNVPQRPPDRRFVERPLNLPGNIKPPVPFLTEKKPEEPAREPAVDVRAPAEAPARAQGREEATKTAPAVTEAGAKAARGQAGTAPAPQPAPPAAPPAQPPARQEGKAAPSRPAYQGRPAAPGGAVPKPPFQGQQPHRDNRAAGARPGGAPPHQQPGARPDGRPAVRDQGAGLRGAQTPGPRPGGGYAGGPRPGGPRPAGPRPAAGRPGRLLDLNKAIPKPPTQVVEVKPDKGAAQQRLAANRERGPREKRWDERKPSVSEAKLLPRGRRPARVEKPPVEKRTVVLTDSLTVKDLAEKMSVKAADVIKELMMLGVMATINQEIDVDTASIVATEMGYPVEIKKEEDIEEIQLVQEQEDDPRDLEPRPPVVTVMGHVDHGKTSLLDAIRNANVTATEHGGITQHIGAYQVQHKGKKITFLDTPGHEAFTAMRARGARVTDVAILVVAADDGVMPQTVEAINHAKAAGVPIIVAINKIDKPEANPERVKQQLTEHGLVVEEWGGDVIAVPVSALKHQGLDELLEMVLLVAEMSELKANPKRLARGTIVESKLDKGRGPVATVLVQNGTLRTGDAIVAGPVFARVRAMIDHKGRSVKKAGPSMPVEILGFSEVPAAGDTFFVVEDERIARQIAVKRQAKKRQEELKAVGRISLEDVFKRIQEGEVRELPLVLKADVQGSVEALAQALERLSTEEVKVHLIHQGVGAIRETDILLASASNAIIIGFNVRPDVNARRAAEREKVEIRLYQVIYDAINDVRAALSGLLEPEYREVVLGHAEIRKVFHASKLGNIAGCYVTEGKITRDAGVRLIRDGVVIYQGKLSSLKRFKDDVREVAQGYECGLTLENYNDIREGDELEFFTTEMIKREL